MTDIIKVFAFAFHNLNFYEKNIPSFQLASVYLAILQISMD